MADDEIISIPSDDSENEALVDRRAILEPAIQSVVDALGGFENGVYRLGDECYSCLKDLKKLWRKDESDDERTVARIFWETRVLPNDLIPILLETAGKGHVEDKRAIACADLMTAMTWPIDSAEELKELYEEIDRGTDYTQLLLSHLQYKAALLQPRIFNALFGIVLPCLAKDNKERKEKDIQITSVVLYLVRNLAFIKDLPSNMNLSSDQAELSSLQSKLIRTLSETKITEFLLTIASNSASNPLFNRWNTLALEIFYLLFRGIRPSTLVIDQAKQPTETLHRLLAVEDQRKREWSRNANSRHSRFGTTISVTLNPNRKVRAPETPASEPAPPEAGPSQKYVLHRQQAIHSETGTIFDMVKKQKAKKTKKTDELAREDNLSLEARRILQDFARSFIQSAFNPFLQSLLKDIKSERVKVMEKDNLRLLYVTKWFLDFFLQAQAKDKAAAKPEWDFGLVSEVTERSWIIWVLKRMREALEDKPKMWTEFQAGIECLTQLLLLIDGMSSSELSDPELNDAAEILQNQLIYNGEVLDIALESLRAYKEGTQSLVYLDSSVHLAYALLRMLEKWTKAKGSKEMYIRKKARKKRRKVITEEDGIPDVEEEDERPPNEDTVRELKITFEGFEAKFANADIAHTLLVYLARYQEFQSPENMKRVVNLLHRQVVRAKAEGLFFKVSTMNLFKGILDQQKSLPKDQPYKDLVALIQYLLRQFFKAVDEEPFLIVQALFPKNRNQWKQFSSWQPEEKAIAELVEDTRFPQDVKIKKGYTWSQEMGIAVACLLEDDRMDLIDWIKEILSIVIAKRQRIVEETDGVAEDDDESLDAADVADALMSRKPSSEAIDKFNDYLIPYSSDEHATAATKNPKFKLLMRLLSFTIHEEEEDSEELLWLVPKAILPFTMQSQLNVINQYLENPFDLEGKKASELLNKKPRKRRRRRALESDDDEIVPELKKKKERKKKEQEKYKSADMIEDSDADEGTWAEFFEKEKKLKLKAALAAKDGGSGTMKPTGTKKRQRRNAPNEGRAKRRKGAPDSKPVDVADKRKSDSEESEEESMLATVQKEDTLVAPTRPRPKPRPRIAKAVSSPSTSPPPSELPLGSELAESRENSPAPPGTATQHSRKKTRLIISDDED